MGRRWFFALAVSVLVPATTFADVKAVTRASGVAALELVDAIRLGQIAQGDLAGSAARFGLNPAQAVTLWNAVKLQQSKGLLPNDAEFAAIRESVLKENLLPAAVVTKFAMAASTNASVTSQFSVQTVAAAVDNTAGELYFSQYKFHTQALQQWQASLVNNPTEPNRKLMGVVGSLLQVAVEKTPTLCSADARSECTMLAPEVIGGLAQQGYLSQGDAAVTFARDGILGAFVGLETPNYAGQAQRILYGVKRHLAVPRTQRDTNVEGCLVSGHPPAEAALAF